jgi:hypothetical protein
MSRSLFSMHKIIAHIAVIVALVVSVNAHAQVTGTTPSKPSVGASDSAMTFQPSQPLIRSSADLARAYPSAWGFDASFSDYGFGGGMFLSHNFSGDFTGVLSADVGTAKGSREFDLLTTNSKINRIFVIPIIASVQYRLFHYGLSDNLRPYVTVGAGPTVVMTTPAQEEFFSSFHDAQSKIVPGGFVGLGANFGTDPKGTFGASLRYFIIPYPGAVQSTTSESLTNFNALFLTVSYGFNF